MNKTEIEQDLKNTILSSNKTFKAAFMATMGFYVAQTVATFLGLGTIVGGIWILYWLLKK